MFDHTSVGARIDSLHRVMDVAELRQSIVADNIANAETPNFKRAFVNFESRLADAYRSGAERPRFAAARTDADHIGFHRTLDPRDVRPRVLRDWYTTAQNNGNNVDIDVEAVALQQNALRYQMASRITNDLFQRINIVLR